MTDHNTVNSKIVLHNSGQQTLSQAEIEEKYLALQTILGLTEINASFYELLNSLQNKLNRWETKYFKIKMNAFLKLAVSTSSYNQQANTQVKQPQNGFSNYHRNDKIMKQVKLKSKKTLKRMMVILLNKQSNLLYGSFIRISNTVKSGHALKMASDKSSKIQTNDSFKSKIFKRSPQKKQISRKSYSMDKSPLSQQHEYIQVKYQPQSAYVPISTTKARLKLSHSQFFNIIPCNINNNQQRHSMISDRDQDSFKSSTRKMHTTSMKLSKRNQKIFQLQSLRRKYDKLMSEFNGFSVRFLKVIEEEEDVK